MVAVASRRRRRKLLPSIVVRQVLLVVVVVLLPFVVGWQTTTGAALRRSHHHYPGSSSSLLSLAASFSTAEDSSVTVNDNDTKNFNQEGPVCTPTLAPTTPTAMSIRPAGTESAAATTSRRSPVQQLVWIATTGRLLLIPCARAAAEPEVDPFALMDALVSDTVDEILTNGNTTNNHNHNIQQEGTRPTPLRDGITGNGENNKNTSNEHTSTPNSDMDSALRDAQNRRTVLPRTHG